MPTMIPKSDRIKIKKKKNEISPHLRHLNPIVSVLVIFPFYKKVLNTLLEMD